MGITYREATRPAAATFFERAVVAYVAADVVRQGSAKVVLDMITSLAIEEGDWLWEPAQAQRERQPVLFEVPRCEEARC